MGLDMYLRGEKFFWTDWADDSKNRKEDGEKVHTLHVELGYWRKHANLHGFIVEQFAAGVDECQRIDLSVEQLKATIEAVKNRKLPHTEGFFFGASELTDEEIAEDVAILEKAIAWLEVDEPQVSRDVYYQASW
jgi:hypothetical protein